MEFSIDYLKDFAGMASVPVVVGLVEVFKGYFPNKKSWPLISLIIAVLFNLLIAYGLSTNYVVAVVSGVVSGLAASGLWSVAKTATE